MQISSHQQAEKILDDAKSWPPSHEKAVLAAKEAIDAEALKAESGEQKGKPGRKSNEQKAAEEAARIAAEQGQGE